MKTSGSQRIVTIDIREDDRDLVLEWHRNKNAPVPDLLHELIKNSKEPVRTIGEMRQMLKKVTLIANAERAKGNKEHAGLMVAGGVGIRWVLRDWDAELDASALTKTVNP